MKRAVLLVAVCYASVVASSFAAEPALKAVTAKESITVSKGEQKLLEYRYVASPQKPYIKELYTPGGVQVLRDAPHDHLHHHGIMFAVAVDGVDFWAEGAKCGTQQPKPNAAIAPEDVFAATSSDRGGRKVTIEQRLAWNDSTGSRLADEGRRIEAADDTLGATLVTWHTRLSPAAGKQSLKLTGSHYFGLGVRFVESMDKDGAFFNAADDKGENVRGKEFLVTAKWAAYTAKADGKPVTVAVFDHPKNPRHPARMFTMSAPFAYLGATLNLWKEPLELKAGETLDLRYGIAAWDGKVEAKRVEELYEQWAKGM